MCTARFTEHLTYPCIAEAQSRAPLTRLPDHVPHPLPPYLPRNAPLPSSAQPASNAKVSSAGQFSPFLHGMRKTLRRSSGRTEAFVGSVEGELTHWPDEVTVLLNLLPDGGHQFPRRIMAGEEDIREVERSSQILVRRIENDTSARYVCIVAHDVTMSSASVHPRPSCLSPCTVVTRAPLLFICRTGKDARTQRITHILRPNVNAPGLSCARNTRDAAPNRSLHLLTLTPRLRSTLVALGHPVHRRRVGRAFRDRLRIANPELPAHPHRHRAPCADITSEADVGAETGRCGHRSRAGNQGAVPGEQRRYAAPCYTSYRCVSQASYDVRPPSPRTVWVVTIVLACAQEAASSPLG